jgi:DNA-binding CsgD family transcriptional regulator
MNTTRPTEASLVGTIAAIYQAAVVPDGWTAALRRLRDLFATASTAYVVVNADRSRIDRVAAEVDPEGQRANVESLLRGSIFHTRGQQEHTGQITRSAEGVPDKIFRHSRMYQEYWKPRGLHDAIRLTVSLDAAGTRHGINLIRPRSTLRFEIGDITLAGVLMPHLQHAVELRRRLQHADLIASAALATLDALRHPLLLVDENCHLLHANAAGETLLGKADGLRASHGILHGATPTSTNRLHAALARAAGAAGSPPRAGALRLPRHASGTALAILVTPFRRETHWSLARRPTVLVCVTDPDAAAMLPGRQLAELFGLTGAETALAADLLAGLELREIAQRGGRSINTTRTHLVGLMAKTNVNRQSDLMRLLASLPRLTDPT